MSGEYYFLAQIEEGNPIPVVVENVGPYASLEEALAAWPGFTHEVTDDEYERYTAYWEGWHRAHDPGNASTEFDVAGLSEAGRAAYQLGLESP